MFVQPILNNPITRTLPFSVTKLSFDCGRLNELRADDHLKRVRDALAACGLGHIEVTGHKLEGDIRTTYIFLDEMRTIYELSFQADTSHLGAKHKMENVKQNMLELFQWCADNCVGDYLIDERGIGFSELEDSVLYKLRFANEALLTRRA